MERLVTAKVLRKEDETKKDEREQLEMGIYKRKKKKKVSFFSFSIA